MLSDAGGNVGKAYGVYDEDGGIETRGRFIIDPDGVIQAFEVLTHRWGEMCKKRSVKSKRSSWCGPLRGQKRPHPAGGLGERLLNPDQNW